ncbi:MAG: hypothetical protein K0R53_3435, partial [Burkholderiales bacterium]|nr:hypothetical protein [Burkholderiales bacterium]
MMQAGLRRTAQAIVLCIAAVGPLGA